MREAIAAWSSVTFISPSRYRFSFRSNPTHESVYEPSIIHFVRLDFYFGVALLAYCDKRNWTGSALVAASDGEPRFGRL